MVKKKIIYKITAYLIVFVIFFFLSRGLFENWQKIKGYDLAFNYVFLSFSFFYFFLLMISLGLIWGRILRILEPDKKIPYLQAVKINLYAWFGKYLPGKVWTFAGLIHLGRRYGLSRKKLTISAVYQTLLAVTSAFLFSFLLLSFAWGNKVFDYYLVSLLVIISGLTFAHPKVLRYLTNFVLRRFKRITISSVDFLSYGRIIEIISYFFVCHTLNSLAFFCLVRSLVYVPLSDVVGLSGAFVLASVLGLVAIFAPSGLGVRESALVILLQPYFPLALAILLSLVARVWFTIGEIIILIFVYLFSKLKKI